MKRILFSLALVALLGCYAFAQMAVPIANAGSTGTTLNTLTKLTGAPSTAVIAATTDTSGIVGICAAGCGTAGTATIVEFGIQACVFDNTTVAGDYVQISSGTAGNCHDAGSTRPTSGQIIGKVLASGAAGTYNVDLNSAEIIPTIPVPTFVDTTASVTVGGANASEFHFNENATAATAITYTLPTATAGLQRCFKNAYNGTAANTGVLTVATSAAGQFIIFTDGTLSATGGNVTSGGAAADAACVVGVDGTHWQLYVQVGTWTKH